MTDKEYYAAIEAVGHLLKRTDDGEIDSFVLDSGYHNGPGCELCHDVWCEHCQDKIGPCSVGVIDSTCEVVEEIKALPMKDYCETVPHLLGRITPDPVGEFLGTGYLRFSSPFGIDGLARMIEPTKLDLLAVVSNNPGHGNFHRFIEECKKNMTSIGVWEIWNPRLEVTLMKWGFCKSSTKGIGNEISYGVKWETSTFALPHKPESK